MKSLRIPIRVVFYRDDGDWVAHCLELGLIGDGPTRQESLEQLVAAIRLQVEASLEQDNPRNLFSPADGEYFEMFAAGRDVAEGELSVQFEPMDDVRIERVEVREYADSEAALA